MFTGNVSADRSPRTIRGARLSGFLLMTVLLVLVLTTSAFGQATEGAILGTVVDPSGAVAPKATVTITNTQTGAVRTTTTNSDGEYVVTNLPLGLYTVTVEASGYKKSTRPPVDIQIKSRVRVDFELHVGAVTDVVEVSAAAPLLKTDTPEVGGVVSRQTLQEVPIFGRNFLAIASLVPGTTSGPRASRQRDFSGESVTIAGASAEANNFIIDGISNNMEFSGAMGVVPAIDAIQEFAIQTSQYSAEFGRSGGGIVNVAIKSGTNQFHGFAYDYLRNDKLDARPFDFGANQPKPPLRRNQFGAGLGGPIIKDRLFLFGNYEGLRLVSSVIARRTAPTALEKKGDFSKSRFTVYDPATARPDPANPSQRIRDPFPGNVIPASRFNPITVKLLSFFPDPNFTDPNPGILTNYLANESANDTLNAFNIKSDYKLRANDALTGRFSQQRGGRERSSWFPNNVIGAEAGLDGTNTGITYTHVFSPSLVNEARIGYNYLRFGNNLLAHDNILSQFNIPGLGANPTANGYPQFLMSNITFVNIVRPIASLPTPFLLKEHSWQVLDNISWQKAKHALKFGAEYGRPSNARFQGLPGQAFLGFGGNYTTRVVAGPREPLANGVADALLGLSDGFVTQYVQDAIRLSSHRFSAFAQDDWRVTSKLSLSLGLRYEIFTPYRELRDRVVNFDFSKGQRVVPSSTRKIIETGLGIPGGNLPPTFRYDDISQVTPKTNYTNFSPRVGFAYSFNDRLILRGGYGIFFGVTVANSSSNAGTDPPFFTTVALPAELDKPILINNGFPAGRAFNTLSVSSLGGYFQPLDRPDPYAQKYSLNLQVNPFKNTSVEIGLTGQRALKFPYLAWFNFPRPGPGGVQDRRPFPNIGGVLGYVPINDSNYNGLEISFKQRDFHGLSVQSAFTFSKALGYSEGTDGGIITDPYNYRYDYGPLDYDLRKQWVTSWIYRIPTPQGLPAVARHILGNWDTSGLVTLQGGFPFSVFVAGHVLNNGLGGNRADVLRNPNLPAGQRTRDRWFDTEAFGVPPIHTWGNQGKGTLRGPGFAQVDFALQKSVPVTEGKRITFRMEASNFFNRVNLGQPGSTFRGGGFGVIRGIRGGPRNIQMALRFDF